MAIAHQFDALVMVPNCDKNVPGLLTVAARLDLAYYLNYKLKCKEYSSNYYHHYDSKLIALTAFPNPIPSTICLAIF